MVVSASFAVQSKGYCDVVDITDKVELEVAASKIRNGLVTVFVRGSTAGVSTMEFEPGLVADLQRTLEKLIPSNVPYNHDARWGDGNGFSHIRATMMGPSLVVPLQSGKLSLGTWQQIILVDFDNRPRRREVQVQVVGE
ncbi:MAG: secondary thiamine-phosphate synthase enzyme YjbQ [Chloroflexi bacterium]|nr:secondary thiamine-phosphate synthase enzyme YjbQ [Chloroflexota bacterium]MDA8189740.1 secondary thiamine-phosphate synthase enzyme YjbQ [Dehalococcoidales bacterium]